MKQKLTTIIPWCKRPELEHTLRHNTPFLNAMDSDVIVVNCGGDGEWLRRLLTSGELVRATQIDIPEKRFNKSLALNIGIHAAEQGIVFILDADILLTASLRKYVDTCAVQKRYAVFRGTTEIPPRQPAFTPTPGSCLNTIVTSFYTSLLWADGTVTRVERQRSDYRSCRRLEPGLTIVNSRHLLDIGGYRSYFVGWGWEDVDLQVRLQRLGLDPLDVDEEVIHLEHGDDKRNLIDGETRTQCDRNNALRAWRSYSEGDFSGTYGSDVETWEPLISSFTFVRDSDQVQASI